MSVIYGVSSIKIDDERPLANANNLNEMREHPRGEKSTRQIRG